MLLLFKYFFWKRPNKLYSLRHIFVGWKSETYFVNKQQYTWNINLFKKNDFVIYSLEGGIGLRVHYKHLFVGQMFCSPMKTLIKCHGLAVKTYSLYEYILCFKGSLYLCIVISLFIGLHFVNTTNTIKSSIRLVLWFNILEEIISMICKYWHF